MGIGRAEPCTKAFTLYTLLNWIILEFAGDGSDEQFLRYTPEEVGELRQSPLNEVDRYRRQLLLEIASSNIQE